MMRVRGACRVKGRVGALGAVVRIGAGSAKAPTLTAYLMRRSRAATAMS